MGRIHRADGRAEADRADRRGLRYGRALLSRARRGAVAGRHAGRLADRLGLRPAGDLGHGPAPQSGAPRQRPDLAAHRRPVRRDPGVRAARPRRLHGPGGSAGGALGAGVLVVRWGPAAVARLEPRHLRRGIRWAKPGPGTARAAPRGAPRDRELRPGAGRAALRGVGARPAPWTLGDRALPARDPRRPERLGLRAGLPGSQPPDGEGKGPRRARLRLRRGTARQGEAHLVERLRGRSLARRDDRAALRPLLLPLHDLGLLRACRLPRGGGTRRVVSLVGARRVGFRRLEEVRGHGDHRDSASAGGSGPPGVRRSPLEPPTGRDGRRRVRSRVGPRGLPQLLRRLGAHGGLGAAGGHGQREQLPADRAVPDR